MAIGLGNLAHEQIETYLNDHLAGSVAALELLEHLEKSHAGTPLENFLRELRIDVEADRQELETLMRGLRVTESRTRKAAAWITEKITELKLRVDDPASGALRLLEGLEVLSLGIAGKKALWHALEVLARDSSELRVLQYPNLIKRAEEQRSRVERVRLEAAKKALFSP